MFSRANPARSMITKEDPIPPEPAATVEAAPRSVAPSSIRTEGDEPQEGTATAPQAEESTEEMEQAPVSGPVRRRRPEVSSLVLKGCIAQEEPSFRAFVACYDHWVFAIVSRRLGYGPHVEDLAQEIFTKAHVAFPHFEIRDDTPPSSWLATIARHVVADEKRRRGIQTIATEDPRSRMRSRSVRTGDGSAARSVGAPRGAMRGLSASRARRDVASRGGGRLESRTEHGRYSR